jgi:hypothetical protein
VSGLLHLLDELTDAMPLVVSLVTIPLVTSILWAGKKIALSPKSPRAVAAFLLYVICFLTYAVGAGSCALGGFIQGSALCSVSTRRRTWDAVADFYSIQAVWSFAFLAALFFAFQSALALLPGTATGWQRFVFLATAGRHGAWRDSDPARKADLLASDATMRALDRDVALLQRQMNESIAGLDRVRRAMRAVAWLAAIFFPILSVGLLVPFMLGAATQETFTLTRAPTTVSLEAEPGLYWFSMAASVLLSALVGLAAYRAIRLLRSDKSPAK